MKMFGMGRVGRDAETRYLPSGDAVTDVSIAYVCGIKKQSEQYPPSQWMKVTIWGKRGETLAPFLKKNTVHGFYLSDIVVEQFDGKGHLRARCDDVTLGPRSQGTGQGEERYTHRPPQNAPQPGDRRNNHQRHDDPQDDDVPF